MQSIAHVAIVVQDYDEAIDWFTSKLGFTLIEDRPIPEQNKRWVTVSPPGSSGTSLLLAQAVGDQSRFIGDQTGGRVFLFLGTDDFYRDFDTMRQAGVEFMEEPREEAYGTVAVFRDLYGNLWDFIEYR